MTASLFSIDAEESAKLSDLFWKFEAERCRRESLAAAAVAGGVGVSAVAGSAFASGGGTGGAGSTAASNAAATIAAGVQNAIDMIMSVNGIALAAFGVALTPLGFMLTLRILNMVLSRV
jgi:hypothetical protein